MRNVEVARAGREDGIRARVGAFGATAVPSPEVAGSWLREHLDRIPALVSRRLYLWSFREGWASAHATSTRE